MLKIYGFSADDNPLLNSIEKQVYPLFVKQAVLVLDFNEYV